MKNFWILETDQYDMIEESKYKSLKDFRFEVNRYWDKNDIKYLDGNLLLHFKGGKLISYVHMNLDEEGENVIFSRVKKAQILK